jgi:hypothetical protein
MEITFTKDQYKTLLQLLYLENGLQIVIKSKKTSCIKRAML